MSICTLLPLERFREIIGFNPFHFFQLASQQTPLTSQCIPFLREYTWQFHDAAGRNEVREAIAEAEQRISEWLMFSPAPHYVTETIDINCFIHSPWCAPNSVKLGEGRLQKIATETWAVEAANVAVNYSDQDHDNLNDTFTATFSDSTTTDFDDLKVYFSASDQFTDDDLCRWEIRPVHFKRTDANTVQVQGRAWLCVKPVKYEGVGAVPGYDASMTGLSSAGALDPTNAANFVSTVDIYKRTYSNVGQVTLQIDDGTGTYTSYQLNATILDAKTGIIAIDPTGAYCGCGGGYSGAWWNGWYGYGSGIFPLSYPDGTYPHRPIQRLVVNYRAGELIKNWDTAIARYAMADLARPICGCEEFNRELYRWQADMSQTGSVSGGGASQSFRRVGNNSLSNPFGHRAGYVYAWEQVAHLRSLRGFYAG